MQAPDEMEDQLAQIGVRIREWREELGFTLQELADRSKVATSTIQKVETAQMIPTVAVLMKIARGLGRRPSELISEEQPEVDVAFLRAKDHYTLGAPRGMRVERLSGDVFEPTIEVWRITLATGLGSGRGNYGFDGEEVIICEEGSIVVSLGEDEYRLQPGDSLHFKAALPHSWRNDGDVRARFLVVCDFPGKMRAALHRRIKGRSR